MSYVLQVGSGASGGGSVAGEGSASSPSPSGSANLAAARAKAKFMAAVSRTSSTPTWMSEMMGLEEETGLTCMVCHEGYKCKVRTCGAKNS